MTQIPSNDFAILIPAYNEEKTILSVVTPLLDFSQHIIVVADGCTDKTINCIEHLPITILRHEHNQGKGAALQTGFSFVKGLPVTGVVTIDADGQHQPDDIQHLIEGMKRYPQSIIIGARQNKKNKCPVSRYYANQIADFFISILINKKIEDSQSGFRFYPQHYIEHDLSSMYHRFGYETFLILNAKKHHIAVDNVPISALYPVSNRKSYYAPIADTIIIIFIILVQMIKNVPRYLKQLIRFATGK